MILSLPVLATFSAALANSAGETNWPFLILTARPVLPASTSRSVWRQKKCRDLQNVHHFGGRLGLRRLVNVGEHRDTELAHLAENAQAFFQSRSAI